MLGYIQFDVEVYSKDDRFRGIKRFTLFELLSAQFKWDFHYQEDKQIFNNLKNILVEEF
jgi:hypothetical protein